jgi:hypothetical protein
LRLVSAGVVDQDHAHHFGRKSVKMCAIFPHRLLLVQEPQVEFVDQNRGLNNIRISLAPDIGCGHFPQMRIDKGHQLIERRGLAVSPLGEK